MIGSNDVSAMMPMKMIMIMTTDNDNYEYYGLKSSIEGKLYTYSLQQPTGHTESSGVTPGRSESSSSPMSFWTGAKFLLLLTLLCRIGWIRYLV